MEAIVIDVIAEITAVIGIVANVDPETTITITEITAITETTDGMLILEVTTIITGKTAIATRKTAIVTRKTAITTRPTPGVVVVAMETTTVAQLPPMLAVLLATVQTSHARASVLSAEPAPTTILVAILVHLLVATAGQTITMVGEAPTP